VHTVDFIGLNMQHTVKLYLFVIVCVLILNILIKYSFRMQIRQRESERNGRWIRLDDFNSKYK